MAVAGALPRVLGVSGPQWSAPTAVSHHLSAQDLGLVNASLLPPPECARRGGHPRGPGCHTVPDVAVFSVLLFLTSFFFAMALKHLKTSRFFPSVVSVTSFWGRERALGLGPCLQKGAGFHLDLFCVAALMLLTSALGLPWYVSATVISLAHMDSLSQRRRPL